MIYQAPKLQLEGPLTDVLRRLIPRPKPQANDLDSRVWQLIQFINSHLDDFNWDLETACRSLRLDISPPHAARLFRRYTGLGVREYAKQKRLAIAADRLAFTALPIKVIACNLGYRQPVDFTRTFKAQYHVSPTEFRRRSAQT
jgi:AraC-like DNA-binding protein